MHGLSFGNMLGSSDVSIYLSRTKPRAKKRRLLKSKRMRKKRLKELARKKAEEETAQQVCVCVLCV